MPTGDEPQLGGLPQDTDLSPMIGGRGRRIVVSPQGAYAVGNIRALIGLMEDAQRQEFQRIVVTTLIDVCEQLHPQLVLYQNRAREVLNLARQWLSEPTVTNGLALVNPLLDNQSLIFDAVNNRPRFHLSHNQGAVFGLDAFEDLLAHMVNEPEMLARYTPQTRFTDYRWKLEVAWALLHGEPTPDYETFITDDITGIYRAGNAHGLTRRMDEIQQHRFKQAVMQKFIEHILSFKLEAISSKEGQHLLKILRLWQDESDWRIIRRLNDEFRRLFNQNPDRHMRDLLRISSAADPLTYYAGWNVDGVKRAFQEVGWKPQLNDLQRWYVESAWAILNDQPIPPLSDRMTGGHQDVHAD